MEYRINFKEEKEKLEKAKKKAARREKIDKVVNKVKTTTKEVADKTCEAIRNEWDEHGEQYILIGISLGVTAISKQIEYRKKAKFYDHSAQTHVQLKRPLRQNDLELLHYYQSLGYTQYDALKAMNLIK